jgi:hypothetical protein
MLRVIAIGALAALTACFDVGDVRDQTGPGGGPDAGPDDPGAPDGGTAAAECVDAVAGVGGGEHNPGQACIACHAADGGPTFTLAGTLYADLAGTMPLAGATILVTDASGATTEVVTQQNGNFWTNDPLAFPVRVSATRCPDTTPMIGTVAAPGDCNSGGCHAAGGATGPIHLP